MNKNFVRSPPCLGIFAFLRASEFTVPSDLEYDAEVHLGRGNLAMDDPGSPSFVRVCIKQSKTDPFRQGVYLYVGRTGTELCPVAALLHYLCVRGPREGPLFRFEDGRPLIRPRLVAAMRLALAKAGINQTDYCSHSFRIGAATTAAEKGIEDSVIKTLGRWKSAAYQQYVRIPTERLSTYQPYWLLLQNSSRDMQDEGLLVYSGISVIMQL